MREAARGAKSFELFPRRNEVLVESAARECFQRCHGNSTGPMQQLRIVVTNPDVATVLRTDQATSGPADALVG